MAEDNTQLGSLEGAGGEVVSLQRARLLVSCPDQPGIVAAVSQFLFSQGANIVEADQHSSATTDRSSCALNSISHMSPSVWRGFAMRSPKSLSSIR